ncbi:hypothetical protein [Priestia megaterium]|uniref:hypothetical protein n=1 Tax=Priestia megaterium TaxID=1404 RepID=UPI000EF9B909|nr:hypothetical protein [Priestia megaterium]RMA90224.1 hypothetical protein DEU44_2302 [Priestia megaterium]
MTRKELLEEDIKDLKKYLGKKRGTAIKAMMDDNVHSETKEYDRLEIEFYKENLRKKEEELRQLINQGEN